MNTMDRNTAKISKCLSYWLRHKPDAIGLSLDPGGWADIEDLIAKADIPITHKLLNEVVAINDKKRFAISEDGLSIRANQGHSFAVDLGLEPVTPPELLYHGTAARFLDSIREQGLKPQSRQYVHLSEDHDTAINVGKRHGKPIVLVIPAGQMHKHGHRFFRAENGVWLIKMVPAESIEY